MAMFSRRLSIVVAAGLLALGGCNTAHRNIGMEDPAVGEAVRYDAAIQIINPVPLYPAGSAQPGDNGDVGAKAVKRYRTDAVKQVEVMQTSTGGGASGGSSGAPR